MTAVVFGLRLCDVRGSLPSASEYSKKSLQATREKQLKQFKMLRVTVVKLIINSWLLYNFKPPLRSTPAFSAMKRLCHEHLMINDKYNVTHYKKNKRWALMSCGCFRRFRQQLHG